jgi:hypothetical protein
MRCNQTGKIVTKVNLLAELSYKNPVSDIAPLIPDVLDLHTFRFRTLPCEAYKSGYSGRHKGINPPQFSRRNKQNDKKFA